jgi:hypothetical protein
MWQLLYKALIAYEGVYLFYLAPIIYFLIIVFNVFSSKRPFLQHMSSQDVITALAIGFITLDFMKYAYLFFTETTGPLSSQHLLIKYTIGSLIWIWIFWYSYKNYLAYHIAGKQFNKRWTGLVLMCVGSFALAVVGIMIS